MTAEQTDRQTDRQTDGQTDGRGTKGSLCAAMVGRQHKKQSLSMGILTDQVFNSVKLFKMK